MLLVTLLAIARGRVERPTRDGFKMERSQGRFVARTRPTGQRARTEMWIEIQRGRTGKPRDVLATHDGGWRKVEALSVAHPARDQLPGQLMLALHR